jgi:hypothetical protein
MNPPPTTAHWDVAERLLRDDTWRQELLAERNLRLVELALIARRQTARQTGACI